MIGCRHWQSILVGSGIARGQDAIPCVRHRSTRWRNRDGITPNSSENTSNAAPFHKGKEEISLASHAACPFPRSPSAREDRSTLRGGGGGGGDEDVGRSEFALAPSAGSDGCLRGWSSRSRHLDNRFRHWPSISKATDERIFWADLARIDDV
jgi:hypothetical protein